MLSGSIALEFLVALFLALKHNKMLASTVSAGACEIHVDREDLQLGT